MSTTDEFRRTGRTTRQLLDAPEDFYFVVRTIGMRQYTEALAREYVPEKRVRIVAASDVYSVLRNVFTPIVVDHAARDVLSEADWRFITAHNERNWPR